MRRGTTPVLRVNVTGIEVTELNEIYLTIKQGTTELTKRETEIEKDTSAGQNLLLVPLTQEETLKFKDGSLQIQLRSRTLHDKVIASGIVVETLDHILMEGEI